MQKNTNQTDTVDFTVTFNGIPRKYWNDLCEFQLELAKLVLESDRKIGLNEIVNYDCGPFEKDLIAQILAKVATLLHFQSQSQSKENEKK